MAKLLVIEDDELLRDALAAQLRYAGHQAEAVADGEQALQLLAKVRFDATVLDLGLPGMDGLDVLDCIRQRTPALPVLILTARDGIDDRVAGLQRGADDYLTKPFEMSELIARIASLLRRSKMPAFVPTLNVEPPPSSNNAAAHDELRLDPDIPRAWLGSEPTELTQREWELLRLLVAHTGQVVSRDAVFTEWHTHSGAEPLQSNALEVYVHRLRRKLSDSPWSIRNIRGLGYMLERSVAS
jgi:two-component system response regulator QseB